MKNARLSALFLEYIFTINSNPFAPIIMSETNKLILERIQRRAIRVAIYWPVFAPEIEFYQKNQSGSNSQ